MSELWCPYAPNQTIGLKINIRVTKANGYSQHMLAVFHLMFMTLENARQILGQSSQRYTDQELAIVLEKLKGLADSCCDHIRKRQQQIAEGETKCKLFSLG